METILGLSKTLPNIGFSSNLKDLIKSIRLCKTASEERTVIQKESASRPRADG
jgi:hypothetical protein